MTISSKPISLIHFRFRDNSTARAPATYYKVTAVCNPPAGLPQDNKTTIIAYIWDMDLMTLIRENNTEFVDLCRSHKVNKIYAFGSSITDQFDPKSSDIDVVVKIDIDDPADRGEALLSLWDKLETLFQRKVDLLTEDSIRNPYLKSNINRTKKLIYDGDGEKVSV